MKRARFYLFIVTSLLLLILSPGRSATIHLSLHGNTTWQDQGPAFSPNNTNNDLWVDDDFASSTPGWGVTHFSDIPSALMVALPNDVINIYSGTYNGEIVIDNAVSLIAVSGEYPILNGGALRSGSGITINTAGVIINGLTIKDFNYGIVNAASGECQVIQCQIFDNTIFGIQNLNTSYEIPAEDCYWGASSGPYDNSDDRTSGGLFNPNGIGNEVTDQVDYYPWSINQDFDEQPVEFGIFITACGELEIRLKPLTDISSSTITMLTIAMRWPANTVDITSVSSPAFNISLQQTAYDIGGYNYAVLGSDDFTTISLSTGTEVPIASIFLDETGSGFADFEIVLDSWTMANNADPYLELWGTDYTGFFYQPIAEDVYLAPCGNVELRAKVLLQGPYDPPWDEMNTAINGDIPSTQPYFYPPWSYYGNEHLDAIPANMVDWVLVELRSTTEGNPIDRAAAVLLQDGTIMDTSMNEYVRFDGINPLDEYFVIVHHRNHFPVMSANPVAIPNATCYNFSDTVNFPSYGYAKNAQIELESGLFGMITGDINNDGKLVYSGGLNDRALIINRIFYVTGSPILTQTILGYYQEDLTMDDIVKYSGPGNDQKEIILNLVALTGETALTTIFNCVVPGYPGTPPVDYTVGGGRAPKKADIGIFNAENLDELVIKIRPDHDIDNLPITNIQFTLRWPETSSVTQILPTANPVNGTFSIQPQGPVTIADGYKHQIFAAVNGNYVDWLTGQEYPVLYAEYLYDTPDCTEFEISDDAWTNANNGVYYFEVLGANRTGIRYEPILQVTSEGGWVEGSQQICIGYSTGTLLLMDYSGLVTKWQKRHNGGTWTDIPGTAGLLSYSEIPADSGIWDYRAEVQKFGCTSDVSDFATIDVEGYVIWTGNVDSYWNDANNWNVCGIPDINHHVIIPNVSPNPFPVVTVKGYCKTLLIKSGASVHVTPPGSIRVGNLTLYESTLPKLIKRREKIIDP